MCLDSVQIPCQSMILCCFIYALRATDFGVCGRRGYPGTVFHISQSMILDVLFFRGFCVRIYVQRSEKHLGGIMWLTCS